MRVLGISGSPRENGNTDIIVKEALEGARLAGATVEFVGLSGKCIEGCRACAQCGEGGVCIIKDDMQAIHDEIRTADRIIVASPIFFFGVSAQTKIMIDRCQAFWAEKYVHKNPVKPGAFGRKGLLLLVGGMKRTEKNVGFSCSEATVRAFFRTVNVQEHVTLAYDQIDERGAITKHATAFSEAYEAGRRLAAKSG